MSSSESEDDFLSADEGSDDNELPCNLKNEQRVTLSKEKKVSDLLELPEKVPELPVKVPDLPEKVPELPVKIPELPVKVPDLPEKVPELPVKVPDLPELPEKKPDQKKVDKCKKSIIKNEIDSHLDSSRELETKISSMNISESKISTEEQPISKVICSTEEKIDYIEQEENSFSKVENKCEAHISDEGVNEPEVEEIKQDKYDKKLTKTNDGKLEKHEGLHKDNFENISSNENEKIGKTKDKSSCIVPDSKYTSFTSNEVCADEMVKNSLDTSNITDIYCLNPNEEDSSNVDSVKKPRRVSKIGAKKPREKLGERKKLGTKIARPLDSVSCDDRREPHEQKDQPKRKESLASFGSWEKINSIDATVDAKSEDDASGWSSGWGDWGSSLVSAASTLKQEVSKGVGSVVEMVEEGINIPSPEELAKEQVERDRWINRLTEENSEDSMVTPSPPPETASFGLNLGGFSSLVSGVSGVGSKVMMGGLDTLELIGRKTMTVLQDTDPNIRYKKEQFMAKVNKPNLSSVLREAREFAESNPSPSDSDSPSSPSRRGSHRITYQQLWDNSTGPAHLEALALIARQSSANTKDLMDSLPTGSRQKADALNRKLRELSELEEENLAEGVVFSEQVTATIKLLKLPLNADNIAQCWTDLSTLSSQYIEGSEVLRDTVALDASTVEVNLLGSCVSLVERIVSVAHKAAEICLSDISVVNALELAINYKELTVLGGSHLDSCTDTVCTGLSSTEQYEKLSPLITNIYMQVCEGTSCLQQSLVHLCTTLQLVQAQQIKDSL